MCKVKRSAEANDAGRPDKSKEGKEGFHQEFRANWAAQTGRA